MKLATNLGVVAAIMFMLTLVAGAVNAIIKDNPFVSLIGSFTAIGGLLVVIVAAAIVVKENSSIQIAIDDEISGIPELRDHFNLKEPQPRLRTHRQS